MFSKNDDPKIVEKQLYDIEKKYEKNAFIQHSLRGSETFKKKDRFDWNEKYLEELKLKIMSGLISKELIIHLAEVHNYLRKKKFFFFFLDNIILNKKNKQSSPPLIGRRSIFVYLI